MLNPHALKQLSAADTRDLAQRLVCFWFGFSVIGQLWLWPLFIWAAFHSAVFAGVLALYLAYAWGPGLRATAEEGPTPIRSWGIWRVMGQRFDARLVKTADLPPVRNYVFAAYPHGVTAISGWLGFATEATGFSKAFPGIRAYPCTLESNFRCPLLREYCLLAGLRSCGRRALLSLLRTPGASAVLFPGGATEAVEAIEGRNRVVLRRRKGFARIALLAGADLVPVACFGESDLFHVYKPPPGSFGAKFQAVSHYVLPGRQPLFWGDGLLPDTAGVLPLAAPLTTVVGSPLRVDKWQGPAQGPEWDAAVDALHARYCGALEALWGEWRAKARPGREYAPLEIVG